MAVLLATSIVLPKLVQKNSPDGIGSAYVEYVSPEPVNYTDPKAVLTGKDQSGILSPNGSGAANSAINYDQLINPFVAHLQNGDLLKAEATLAKISHQLPNSMRDSLRLSLNSTRQTIQAQALVEVERKKREAEQQKAAEQIQSAYQEGIKASGPLKEIPPFNTTPQDSLFADNKQPENEAQPITPPTPVGNLINNSEDTALESKLANIDSAPANTILKPLPTVEPIDSPQNQTGDLIVVSNQAPVQLEKAKLDLPIDATVKFGFNSSVVPYQAQPTIDRVAQQMLGNTNFGVQLRGYSDSIGNAAYNQYLSKARSQSIKDSLVSKGVDPSRIELISFGSTVSPAGRSQDHRRVDVVFIEL